MIISASRRTDIPSHYSDWFFNRIREGFVCVRNPMNARQVSRVPLNPDVVDGLVLWTKNPIPLLGRLGELAPYPYYFQFTLNAYQADVEPGLPSKNDVLIPAFQRLSDMIGPDRVVWRYDPILLNAKYQVRYHVEYFEKIARRLKDYTRKCTISFIDYYRGTAHRVKALGLAQLTERDVHALAGAFSKIAREYGLGLDTCAEGVDLSPYGIGHARCVDGRLLEKISGFALKGRKDKNQRPACGCMESIDIGAYDTCKTGCVYCYANHSLNAVESRAGKCDPASPILCGRLTGLDGVSERRIASNKVTAPST